MKLTPDASTGYSIHSYDAEWININGQRHTESILLSANQGPYAWNCRSFDDLSPSHFERLIDFKPEMVVFGSGNRLQFPPAHWLQSLYARRIGVETMDTQAACRTFNFLVAEGRVVVAALLLESGKP